MTSDVMAAYAWKSNAHMLADLFDVMGRPSGPWVDLTFGEKGAWWNAPNIAPDDLVRCVGPDTATTRDDAQVREHTKKLANASAIISFANRVMCDWPDAMFHDLAKFDYLSCFCPLDRPCHVDAIIVEGARRGMWGGG